MNAAPLPRDEADRLAMLHRLRILDTPADHAMNALVRLASNVLGCPISLVSLVDADRQWFKAAVGFEASETPRDSSFCAHAILGDEILEVPDATNDPRFANNPLVTGEAGIRFYAGVPVRIDEHRIGTLCVIDQQPRQLTADQRRLLADFGKMAENWLSGWRHQMALRDSEAFHKPLFDKIADGVILCDREGRILDLNLSTVNMLGYGREELLNRRLRDVLDPGYIGPLRSMRDALESSAEETFPWQAQLTELIFYREDGVTVPVESHFSRLEDGRFLAVLRDITERRAKDAELQQLQMAVEQTAQSILITNLDDSRVEYANPAAAALWGYTRAELVGIDPVVLRSGDTPAEVYEEMYAQVDDGVPWSGLLSSRRKDGSVFIQFASVSPIRGLKGQATKLVSVFEDVTEKQRLGAELDVYRHQLEELVVERTRELDLARTAAEAANEAKSDFLATMSHELRTPMNGVIGMVDLLRQSSLTPYQYEISDTIRDSAFALLDIIDEVLDISKIEAGGMVLEEEAVELLPLVEGVCDALQPIAAKKGTELQVFVDPVLPAYVSTDPLRLRQILNNLVGNAIKFAGVEGRPGLVRVSVEMDATHGLLLRVRDNGIGMTEEVQAKIFQPFVQGDSSTARQFGGSGLGLTICGRLVDLLGGSIEVESVVHEGSTFSVRLPLRADPSREAGPQQDLSRVDCHIVCTDGQRGRDWSAYLIAAGARPKIWASLKAFQRGFVQWENHEPVVIADASIGDDLAPFMHEPGRRTSLALVQVGPGHRRSPRLVARGKVSLDGDALHRDALLLAVSLAIGRCEPALIEVPSDGFNAAAAPIVDEATARGRLVLVAEDNDINQKVIARQLALLGIAADIAPDGGAALRRWRSGRYAMILTDLNMPLMDGYELTAAIRSEEDAGRRIPIVALTANAIQGVDQRCRNAGMDGYLIKPVQLERLGAMLSQWLPPGPESAGPVTDDATTEDSSASIFDASVLRQLIGEDPGQLAEFEAQFIASARHAVREIRVALAAGDLLQIEAVSHRLKSSARAVGTLALGACCEHLETSAGRRDIEQVRTDVARFEQALSRVRRVLDQRASGVVSAAPPPVRDVLLVDDEPFHLRLVEKQMETLGVEVATCQSGEQALEWLQGRDTSKSLLLLDLNMPAMDGVELMRHMAESGYRGAIALISGADPRLLETAAKLATAYRLSVIGHLHKPVSMPALRHLIDAWSAFKPKTTPHAKAVYGPEELRDAITAGQLVLHYQPKVSMRTGAIVGVEALVRWQHPADGLQFPDTFVAVAEACGLIDELTRCVLTMALAQTRRWRADGLTLRVAVNVSMDNLTRVDFVEFVLAEVERHGLRPDDVILEITESRLMSDSPIPMDILTRLRMKNFGLSIDDFGTGHSSLAKLRDIPFNELKIDRSFVHGVRDRPTERAIFTASAAMARELGIDSVAEGVEDRADWEFVKAANCDVAQGYFIGRPMRADALAAWVGEWQKSFEAL